MERETLSDAVARLEARGFRRQLRAEHGRLVDASSGERFEPEALEVAETVRFEGATNPADMSVVFALNGPDGAPLGTYAAPFGPEAPAADADVVRRLGD